LNPPVPTSHFCLQNQLAAASESSVTRTQSTLTAESSSILAGSSFAAMRYLCKALCMYDSDDLELNVADAPDCDGGRVEWSDHVRVWLDCDLSASGGFGVFPWACLCYVQGVSRATGSEEARGSSICLGCAVKFTPYAIDREMLLLVMSFECGRGEFSVRCHVLAILSSEVCDHLVSAVMVLRHTPVGLKTIKFRRSFSMSVQCAVPERYASAEKRILHVVSTNVPLPRFGSPG